MSYLDYLEDRKVTFVPSQIESERFGLAVARATITHWKEDATAFLNDLSASNFDVVVLRTKSQAPNLAELNPDFTFIEAGELTYWSSGHAPEFLNSTPSISYFSAKDHLEEFMSVISNSFQSYRNHYSYNPLFDEYSAREAYVDWGRRCAISSQEEQFAGVMKFNESPVGAISGSRVDKDLEVELAGIHSDFQGQGLYVNLIGEFWRSIEKSPDARLVISTQVENVNVQSAWQKMNLKQDFSVHTTHLVRKSLLA